MKHESMYLHPELETMTRPEIEKLQMERLQQTLQRCMRTPFYKQRFAEIGLKPEDIARPLSFRTFCSSVGRSRSLAFFQRYHRHTDRYSSHPT